ncbi:hypothetical protein BKA15_000932 [Microlunatus parietis]|uniref:Uncharacterized protein n=1 Tax=Microlunatus parietis TaxID=682979 RepID=A0A7Y9I3J4_9ACTN|nr:hypothetical protein [Microlunatus parietis]
MFITSINPGVTTRFSLISVGAIFLLAGIIRPGAAPV